MAATAVRHAGMNLLPTTQALCNVTVHGTESVHSLVLGLKRALDIVTHSHSASCRKLGSPGTKT